MGRKIKTLVMTADGSWEEEEESVEASGDEDCQIQVVETLVNKSPVKKRVTKRVKSLVLVADGSWQEEEESVEVSGDEETEHTTKEVKDNKLNDAIDPIPAWREGICPLKVSDSESEEEPAWNWMNKPKPTPNVAKDEALAIMDEDVLARTEGVACDEEYIDAATIDVATTIDVAANEPIEVEKPADTEQDYKPGCFLALLLRPEESSESDTELDVEDDDVDRELGIVRERSKSRSRSPPLVPKAKSYRRPVATPLASALDRPVAREKSCRGCLKKGMQKVPKMRGSIQLCFPSAKCKDSEMDELDDEIADDEAGDEEEDAEYGKLLDPNDARPDILVSILVSHVPPEASPEEMRAIQVLARHVVRLGGPGTSLESTIVRALRAAPKGASEWRRWEFLSRPSGIRAYFEEKRHVSEIFAKHDYDRRRSDEEVRNLYPAHAPRPPPRMLGLDAAPPKLVDGNMVNIAIPHIRFAHDSQRELFGHLKVVECHSTQRSILQLAVELITGLTLASAVPYFKVCYYNESWYCYSGNRRLAAFRLAHHFSPQRFRRLILPVAHADNSFLRGTGNYQQKLTTSRNGEECLGRWLVLCETGEAVGRALPGCREYGTDLMSLIPPLEDPPMDGPQVFDRPQVQARRISNLSVAIKRPIDLRNL